MPPNFRSYPEPENAVESTLHVAANNIDLMTDTLDGKKTFHATQMVGFQRSGKNTDDILNSSRLGAGTSLKVPNALFDLNAVDDYLENTEPKFSSEISIEWYGTTIVSKEVIDARLHNIAFAVSRSKTENNYVGWTEFQRNRSDESFDISAMGYMPLILNPAHEIDTLNAVLVRCIGIADRLGKRHIVLTTDQALYCKLNELRWRSETYMDRIVLRMGGLHIAMNFLKVIGQHMNGSGLSEMWLESNLMAEGSISKVFEGKAYAKAMRAHKLTFQAIWKLISPHLGEILKFKSITVFEEFQELFDDETSLQTFLKRDDI